MASPGPTVSSLPVEPERDRALDHLEPLLLERMHVRRRDEAGRLDEALEEDGLAIRVGRGLLEDEALAGDGVLDGVACADHVSLLPSWSRTTVGRSGAAAHRRQRGSRLGAGTEIDLGAGTYCGFARRGERCRPCAGSASPHGLSASANVVFLGMGLADMDGTLGWLPWALVPFVALAFLVPPFVGLLIANRQPRNVIAWILLSAPSR